MDKNIVIVLAGGVGSRTGLDRPKQFVEVLGRPILAYTCDIFQKNQEIDAIEIVCHRDWIDYCKNMVKENNISKVKLALTDGSSWRGSLNEDNQADSASIALDRSSSWELTANSYVTSISDKDASFANIKSNGHNIYYDASQNSALAGRTIDLPGGGKLLPQTKG